MANGLITFNQYVQEKGFDNKTVNRFWKYCNQDIPNKETGQIEWWGRDVTNYNDMVGYSEEFDNLFEEFKNINSSRRNNMIKSSITKDEYFNMVKKHKSTNASTPEFRKQELDAITAFPVGTKFAFKEDNSWHDVNTVYEKIDDNVWKITQVINGKVNDEYTKSDDEVRIYISDEFGGNAYPTSYVSGYGSINSSRKNNMIKSSPNFKEFTADDIFDSFQVEELTHTVFMDREECKNAKCGMDEFSTCMYDVLPTYLGVYTADDVREVCRRAKNPQAKAFLEAFETAMENAKFTDKFYNSVKVHKKIQSELNHFYDPATDYIDEELTEDEEYKYSQFKVETGYYLTPQRTRVDVYTVYSPNDKYLGQTSNPNEILDLIRGKRVNSSKRNNMIKSDKQFRLIDTEHNDPKDGEDFTAEELRDYISKNDKYFDNVGLDYTIVDLNTGEEMNMSTFRLNSSQQIKSAYTREDYDRFDEVGNFIPYKPTEEELAKKDEIKKVLEQELSTAYEPDPMDDYVGYDSTNERIDMACERVAKQFGVDTDFVNDIAGEIDYERNTRAQAEEQYIWEHTTNKDRFADWYYGEDVSLEELGIDEEQMNREVDEIVRNAVEKTFGPIQSSRKSIKSSIITPWDTNQVTGTSDEDLGLSAVVDMYGNEFVNVDESTLNELKDTLVRYFDDEAYVRDWNINNPDYQIEDAFEVTDPEEMSAEDLARYFDYEAYGRDIRLEDNMVWDSENQYWVSAHDVDDEELNDDKYIFMRG